ncbi:hypothetical protein C815_02274 [Firmicutes bacterium M10-2]|nr:hypothetical protein C815_02274 [Firmicutes bacterium M10-2]
MIFEVCAGSLADCIAAQQGGADRVELNSALAVGGLTPSIATLKRVKEKTTLPVICMVRPRAAGFCYEEDEVEVMFGEAEDLLENKADGLAFGFLTDEKNVDVSNTKRMVDLIHSYGKEAVFHRAIDVVNDLDQAMLDLIECNVDRVLTSGQHEKAEQGMEVIKALQDKYGKKIEILAGSGINASNAEKILETTKIKQIHSSCKSYREDPTTKGKEVSYAYLGKPHEMEYDIVSEKLVRELANIKSARSK